MTMERRVGKLETIWRRPERLPGADYDFSALTGPEKLELDQFLARVERQPPRANGRPDYGCLSDEELELVCGYLTASEID